MIKHNQFISELQKDPVKLKKFLRDVMGPPVRTLVGKEKDQTLLLLALTEPFKETNNQHSWTSYYMIGSKEYHVTQFPDHDFDHGEQIVEELLPEDEE